MGTPVPIDVPEIKDDKYYKCTCDCFEDEFGFGDCRDPYVATVTRCVEGQYVRAWQNGGWNCVAGHQLVGYTWECSQRLIACVGPYDSGPACLIDL